MAKKLVALCLLLLLPVSSCDCEMEIGKGTQGVLEELIDELGRQPGRWELATQGAIHDLEKSAERGAKAVLKEVQATFDHFVQTAQQASFCSADFVGIRVRQEIQRILHSFVPDAAEPSVSPVVCTVDPTTVEAGITKVVKYSGFDFDGFKARGEFAAQVEYAAPALGAAQRGASALPAARQLRRALTWEEFEGRAGRPLARRPMGPVVDLPAGHTSVTTNYLVQVDIQTLDGTLLDYRRGPRLVLKWSDSQVTGRSEVPILEHIEPTAEPDSVEYSITVKTGDLENAGTNAHVLLNLRGDRGTLSDHLLGDAKDNHQRGAVDVYRLQRIDLGEILSGQIRHDNTGKEPGWFLSFITIRNETTGREWRFPCDRWLAATTGDRRIERVLIPDTPCQ